MLLKSTKTCPYEKKTLKKFTLFPAVHDVVEWTFSHSVFYSRFEVKQKVGELSATDLHPEFCSDNTDSMSCNFRLIENLV